MKIYPIKTGVIPGERNDCSVRALCNVGVMSYEEARAYMAEKGRKPGDGAQVNIVHEALVSKGLECLGFFGKTATARWLSWNAKDVRHDKGLSLMKARKIYNKGRYVMLMRGHATTMIDGEIVDTHGLKAKTSIVAVYKVKE